MVAYLWTGNILDIRIKDKAVMCNYYCNKISVKDDESSFLLIYRSDTHPDLPYDLKEGTTVTVTFDEIEEYRPNYDRVNSIVIE